MENKKYKLIIYYILTIIYIVTFFISGIAFEYEVYSLFNFSLFNILNYQEQNIEYMKIMENIKIYFSFIILLLPIFVVFKNIIKNNIFYNFILILLGVFNFLFIFYFSEYFIVILNIFLGLILIFFQFFVIKLNKLKNFKIPIFLILIFSIFCFFNIYEPYYNKNIEINKIKFEEKFKNNLKNDILIKKCNTNKECINFITILKLDQLYFKEGNLNELKFIEGSCPKGYKNAERKNGKIKYTHVLVTKKLFETIYTYSVQSIIKPKEFIGYSVCESNN